MIFDWCSSCFGWNKLEEEIEELDRPEVKLDSLNMGLGMWLRNYFFQKTFFVKIHSKISSRIIKPLLWSQIRRRYREKWQTSVWYWWCFIKCTNFTR